MPTAVAEQISALGKNLSEARKRRNISQSEMAERMMVNPKTVARMEAGDPNISVGMIATALWILGAPQRMSDILRPETDSIGLQQELSRLPLRIRKGREITDDMNF